MRNSSKRVMVLGLLLLVVLSMGPRPASAQSPDVAERFRLVDKALRWLGSQQNADGGFGLPSSDPETTCSGVLAFASAYEEPDSVQTGGHSPLDYLETQVGIYDNTAEGVARLILAAVAGNKDPRDFGGTDLITLLQGYRRPSGQYENDASDGIAAQALAIMALQVSREPVPPDAVTWLVNQRNGTDGGWGPAPEEASDTANTALSVQALIAAGWSPASSPIRDAVNYLEQRQTSGAGFASSAATSVSDPVSTAQAIQALLAAGEDLLSSAYSRCLRTPFDALADAQSGDGSFEGDALITAASTPGLVGRSIPLPGRRLAALKALEWLHTQQVDDGGFGHAGLTADAIYDIELCGQDADGTEWEHTATGKTPLDALDAEAIEDYLASAPDGGPAGELAKLIRAVEAAGGDPYNFAGKNLVSELQDNYNASTGRYHTYKVFSHDLALLALHAVSETIPAKAVTAIQDKQLPEGGWSWGWGDNTPDVDSSGLSMKSLVVAGGPSSSEVTESFAAFLQSVRFPDGAYPDVETRPEPNCNSTALAIQGLLASGNYRQEPLLIPLDTGGVFSSWDALLDFQEPAGSFAFTASSPESRLLATLEAVQTLISPLYPEYEPLSEGNGTKAEVASSRVTCGDGLEIVAPYSGDDNNTGSASLKYRLLGGSTWTVAGEMNKTGLDYQLFPDLEQGAEYDIEVTYEDPEGVSGGATQYLIVQPAKTCIPLVLRAYLD
jgi:prenyltransferase beta subunit